MQEGRAGGDQVEGNADDAATITGVLFLHALEAQKLRFSTDAWTVIVNLSPSR